MKCNIFSNVSWFYLACASSLGVENSKIKNSQLTASSGTADKARLYNTAGFGVVLRCLTWSTYRLIWGVLTTQGVLLHKAMQQEVSG